MELWLRAEGQSQVRQERVGDNTDPDLSYHSFPFSWQSLTDHSQPEAKGQKAKLAASRAG